MPLYVYKCLNCEHEITDVREVDDRNRLPTEECPKCKEANWQRIECARTYIQHAPAWRYRKGSPY